MDSEIKQAVEYCKAFKFHPSDLGLGTHVPVLLSLAERVERVLAMGEKGGDSKILREVKEVLSNGK